MSSDFDVEDASDFDAYDSDDYDVDGVPPLKSIYSEIVTLDGVAITLDVSVNSDEADEFNWLEKLNATARVDDKVIVRCSAKLVDKRCIAHNFWTDMEEPSQEMSSLAFDLFDRYGQLQRIYVDHEIKRGTGAWGPELDEGDILLMEIISVEQSWRRKGLATRLVEKTMELARARVAAWSTPRRLFSFTLPGSLRSELQKELPAGTSKEIEKEVHHRHQAIADRFWRSIGFRRVGDSVWLAHTDIPSHPSQLISADHDHEIPDPTLSDSVVDAAWVQVFDAVCTRAVSDDDCISRLTAALDEEKPQKPVMNNAGNTVLHMAVDTLRPNVARHILDVIPALASIRNSEALTPLEYLREKLEKTRTRFEHGLMTVVISDQFRGFSMEAVECLCLLTDTQYCNLTNPTQDNIDPSMTVVKAQAIVQHTLRLKFGCSCGACISGFLSPKMRHHLAAQSQEIYDYIHDMSDDGSNPWFWGGHLYQEYIPSALFAKLEASKSMCSQFEDALLQIIGCFEQGKIPSELNIRLGRSYVQGGGTLQSVANMIFSQAKDSDRLAGHGVEDFMVFDDPQYDQLPACRNDHEFGFVTAMCGCQMVTPSIPGF